MSSSDIFFSVAQQPPIASEQQTVQGPWNGDPNASAKTCTSPKASPKAERTSSSDLAPHDHFPFKSRTTSTGIQNLLVVPTVNLSSISDSSRAMFTAPKLFNDRVADVFDWVGERPEDKLNDAIIKYGYTDKPLPLLQAESLTARPNVWPSLRSKSGMPVVSALFAHIFEKRQARGRCTAPSTFKPPPRVTLTDSKREAWLRDLASDDVPLRRLSRTIPHGVRGRSLLDQCISKQIPLPRAIWLVKCVGAIEMRTFRRKGVASTAAEANDMKWISDWTALVESTIETTIEKLAETRWLGSIRYVLRLATALYAGSLVDRVHYMHWLLTGLEQSLPDKFPGWLLLVQAHFFHLTCHRRFGHRLARALMLRLQDQVLDSLRHLESITDILNGLVSSLANNHAACLIDYDFWKFGRGWMDKLSGRDRMVLHRLAQRSRLLRHPPLSEAQRHAEEIMRLLQLLDHVTPPFSISGLLGRCKVLVPTEPTLVRCLLQWASSKTRASSANECLALALLRNIDLASVVNYVALIGFWEDPPEQSNIDENRLNSIIAKLAVWGRFPYAHFLQRLVVRGVPPTQRSVVKTLLDEICVDDLPHHTRNFHQIISLRLGDLVDTSELQNVTCAVLRHLPHSGQSSSDLGVPRSGFHLERLTGSQRHLLAVAIVENIMSTVRSPGSEMSLAMWTYAASMTIQLEAYDQLFSLMKNGIQSQDLDVIASITHILTAHLCQFTCLQVVEELTQRVMYRFQDLRTRDTLNRNLLVGVLELVTILKYPPMVIEGIEAELLAYDQRNIVAACSPASDSVMSSTVAEDLTAQDIDRIMTSGNNMDEQLMERTFLAIIQYSSLKEDPCHVSKSAAWFMRLRAFNPTCFEAILLSHLRRFVLHMPHEHLKTLAIIWVGSDCLSLLAIMDSFHASQEIEAGNVDAKAQRCLDIVAPVHVTATASSIQLRYMLATQSMWLQESRLLSLVCRVGSTPMPPRQDDSLSWLIKQCAVRSPDSVINAVNKMVPDRRACFARRLAQALEIETSPSTTLSGVAISMMRRLTLTTALFLDIVLRLKDEDTAGQTPMCEALKGRIVDRNDLWWPRVISVLDKSYQSALFAWSLQAIISQTSRVVSGKVSPNQSVVSSSVHVRIMTILHALLCTEQVYRHLVDALIEVTNHRTGRDSIDEWRELVFALCQLITAILSRHLGLRRHELSIQSLVSLCRLQYRLDLVENEGLRQQVFVASCLVVSGLSDEQLGQVVNTFSSPTDATTMPNQLKFVLGMTSVARLNSMTIAKVWGMSKSGVQRRHLVGGTGSIKSPTDEGRVEFGPFPANTGGQGTETSASPSSTSGQRDADSNKTRYARVDLRPFEMVSDPAPKLGDNDYSISMTLFRARKAG